MIKSLENINMRSIWAFSAIVTVLLIATAAKQVYGEEPNTIDEVISEGLEQCSHIKNAHCFGVITALDNICSVEYFSACFGEKWNAYINQLK
jgi:hypothetical protein